MWLAVKLRRNREVILILKGKKSEAKRKIRKKSPLTSKKLAAAEEPQKFGVL